MRAVLLFVTVLLTVSHIHLAPLSKSEAMHFLHKYGYTNNKTSDEMSSDEITASINDYQTNYNLASTGELDDETAAFMDLPRCGMPDRQEKRDSPYVWRKNHLTYKFLNFPIKDWSRSDTIKEVQKAFEVWSNEVPLTFELIPEGRADIDIYFSTVAQGDGVGKTLAYAYFPENGDITFDAENWTRNSHRGTNFFMTAAHEIGHSLGLEHVNIRQALMYAYSSPYNPNFTLHNNDKSRIKNLYGKNYVCDYGTPDSVISRGGNTIYVLKGQYVWKFVNRKLAKGYPVLSANKWRGVPSRFSSAFMYKDTVNFFTDTSFWQFETQMEEKKFNKVFPNIDGTVVVDNRLYVFSDDKYARYNNERGEWKLAATTKPMSSFWKGVPSKINGVYYDNNNIYFIKGRNVYTFDMSGKRIIGAPIPLNEFLDCRQS